MLNIRGIKWFFEDSKVAYKTAKFYAKRAVFGQKHKIHYLEKIICYIQSCHMYVMLGFQILYAVEQFSPPLFKVICVNGVELSSKLFHCTTIWLSVPINLSFSCDTTFPLCSRFYGILVKFAFSLAARSSEERRLAARFLVSVKRDST